MDYESVAKKILQRVGGKENVVSLVHCMTRLRFTLKDESIVDDEAVKRRYGRYEKGRTVSDHYWK
jgi:PTS system arbutin/cellobiose/salicin-specific IIC component/PTS system beta-glucosides-specific IIC component